MTDNPGPRQAFYCNTRCFFDAGVASLGSGTRCTTTRLRSSRSSRAARGGLSRRGSSARRTATEPSLGRRTPRLSDAQIAHPCFRSRRRQHTQRLRSRNHEFRQVSVTRHLFTRPARLLFVRWRPVTTSAAFSAVRRARLPRPERGRNPGRRHLCSRPLWRHPPHKSSRRCHYCPAPLPDSTPSPSPLPPLSVLNVRRHHRPLRLCVVEEGESIVVPGNKDGFAARGWWHGTCGLGEWNAGFTFIGYSSED